MQKDSRRRAASIAVLLGAALALASCAPEKIGGSVGRADASVTGVPDSLSVAQILRTRPEFSDFRNLIAFAGLWHELDEAKGLTLLAPTNLAFDHSDPAWRLHSSPDFSSQGDATAMRRQSLIETAAIAGIHPPSDFIGKVQDVKSIGGVVLHIDGRTPGVIEISTGPRPPTQFGEAATMPTATMSIPPIQATNGIIYSVNAITVHDQN